MPLYEYECASCGTFELIQRFSDPPLTRCPKCAGRVQKLLSAPAIQFKGTGWYITDYARKSSSEGKKAGETASPAATDAAAPATKKGDSSGGTSDKKD
ncbi:MAG TPA: FmdB family zinc ribbon protein [Vicinamibacteria bacterium]|nr:FmdB family zinc ribbon protein [Vicinamibacteria bacterium]